MHRSSWLNRLSLQVLTRLQPTSTKHFCGLSLDGQPLNMSLEASSDGDFTSKCLDILGRLLHGGGLSLGNGHPVQPRFLEVIAGENLLHFSSEEDDFRRQLRRQLEQLRQAIRQPKSKKAITSEDEERRPTSKLRKDEERRPTSKLRKDEERRPTSKLREDEERRPTSELREEEQRRPTSELREEEQRRPTSELREEEQRRPTSELREEEQRSPTSELWEEEQRSPTSELREDEERRPTSELREDEERRPTSELWEEEQRSPTSELLEAEERRPTSELWEEEERNPTSELREDEERRPTSELWEGEERSPTSELRDEEERRPPSSQSSERPASKGAWMPVRNPSGRSTKPNESGRRHLAKSSKSAGDESKDGDEATGRDPNITEGHYWTGEGKRLVITSPRIEKPSGYITGDSREVLEEVEAETNQPAFPKKKNYKDKKDD